jgi:hypothetical protein
MKKSIVLFTTLAITFCQLRVLLAQSEKQNLSNTILSIDSLFWKAYNNCDVESMQKFFMSDIEFYHDKGGLTVGLENLTAVMRKNLCGNDNFRLRRVPVESSTKVFPMQNSSEIYGAIISGEHFFYVLEKEKEERLDGLAKFTHLWVLRDGVWKMSRVLSYDHGPEPYVNQRKVIKLTVNTLDQFVGQYNGPHTGICNVQREKDLLNLVIGNEKYILYPESGNSFFVQDRDLTFEFSKNEKENTSKMIVRENGNIVEEAERKK